MPIWTLARLEFFLEKSQLFFEEVVSADTEMDHLDALCTGHLQQVGDQRPGGWGAHFGEIGFSSAENLSKQGASNDMLQAENLFQQKTQM